MLGKFKRIIKKARNLRTQDKIVIFVYIVGMIFLIALDDFEEIFDDYLAPNLALNIGLFLYWIMFGFTQIQTSHESSIDKIHIKESAPSLFGNINLGWMGTKVARGLVMFIAFIIMAILWNLSILVIPKSGVGGAIRGGVGMWLLYWVWKNVLPRINIGTQTKENKKDDIKMRYNSEENEFSPSKTELKVDMDLYKQYQEEDE